MYDTPRFTGTEMKKPASTILSMRARCASRGFALLYAPASYHCRTATHERKRQDNYSCP